MGIKTINLTDPSGFTISTPTIREPYRSLAGPAWVAAWGGAAAAAASGGGGAAAGAGGGAVAGLSTSSMASGPPLGSGAIGGQLGLGIGRGLAGALNRRSPIQQIQPSAEQKATDMARGSNDATATSQGIEELVQRTREYEMIRGSAPDQRTACFPACATNRTRRLRHRNKPRCTESGT